MNFKEVNGNENKISNTYDFLWNCFGFLSKDDAKDVLMTSELKIDIFGCYENL